MEIIVFGERWNFHRCMHGNRARILTIVFSIWILLLFSICRVLILQTASHNCWVRRQCETRIRRDETKERAGPLRYDDYLLFFINFIGEKCTLRTHRDTQTHKSTSIHIRVHCVSIKQKIIINILQSLAALSLALWAKRIGHIWRKWWLVQSTCTQV